MFNAMEAYCKSKLQKETNNLLTSIEKDINAAILNGNFECQTYVYEKTNQDVRDKVKKTLNELGYKVEMPQVKNYCDLIEISWKDV